MDLAVCPMAEDHGVNGLCKCRISRIFGWRFIQPIHLAMGIGDAAIQALRNV